jgi:hypothetical protein
MRSNIDRFLQGNSDIRHAQAVQHLNCIFH